MLLDYIAMAIVMIQTQRTQRTKRTQKTSSHFPPLPFFVKFTSSYREDNEDISRLGEEAEVEEIKLLALPDKVTELLNASDYMYGFALLLVNYCLL